MKKAAATPPPEDLFEVLRIRFAAHPRRHPDLSWELVRSRLDRSPHLWRALQQMEATGGEPDVIGHDPVTGECIFVDCSPESPTDRRGLCYDAAAWLSRKQHKSRGSARDLAAAMGIQLLTEEHYRDLQSRVECDTRTSSWLQTPADVRALGGALFGDRRFGRVFIYGNGAESYFEARGFRGLLRV